MGKGSGKRRAEVPDLPCAMKVLCPEELIGCLMGSGGCVKRAMEEETGAHLLVSQRDQHFPGTRLRILTILHESGDGVLSVLSRIIDKIVECGEKESMSQMPAAEPDFLGKNPGQYVCRIAVHPKTATAIIGPKGQNVVQIREEAKSLVSIGPEPDARWWEHQTVKVIASSEGIYQSLQRINDYVQQEAGTPHFKEWVLSPCPASDPQDSGSGGHQAGGHVAPTPKAPAAFSSHHARERPASSYEPEREPERERSPRRNRGEEIYESPSMEDSINGALRIIDNTFNMFPPGAVDDTYIIECEMPRDKVGAMIGTKGEYVKEVIRSTNTQIKFSSDKDRQSESQTMTIQGQIIDTYRAHAMMMKKYHEAARPEEQMEEDPPDAGNVAELQKKMAELQKQLEDAQRAQAAPAGNERRGKSSKGKGKGKGKK